MRCDAPVGGGRGGGGAASRGGLGDEVEVLVLLGAAAGARGEQQQQRASASVARHHCVLEPRQVVALEPRLGNVLEPVVAEFDRRDQRAVDRVDDDRLGRPHAAQPLGEAAVVEDLQQPPAVGIELGLDRMEAACSTQYSTRL